MDVLKMELLRCYYRDKIDISKSFILHKDVFGNNMTICVLTLLDCKC